MIANKRKLVKEIKEVSKIVGRTKALFKDDFGYLIGKIIVIRTKLHFVVDIKVVEKHMEIFSIPLNDWISKKKDGLAVSYIRYIKTSYSIWSNRYGRSRSKYVTSFKFNDKTTKVDIYLSIHLKKGNVVDLVDTKFYASTLSKIMTPKRKLGKCVNYDNYILIDNNYVNVLASNENFSYTIIKW